MRLKKIILGLLSVLVSFQSFGQSHKAYDIDMAREICSSLPLETVEGIWLYPDDNVTVMILHDETESSTSLPTYSISVVETSDARLHPGEVMGKLYATVDLDIYKIELATERNNEILLKPRSVIATLSKDGDALVIKQQKSPLKGRINFNFNRLLPGFWKMVSTSISTTGKASSPQAKVGMVKVFPSIDGNGSSRRKVRYL